MIGLAVGIVVGGFVVYIYVVATLMKGFAR